MTTTTNPATSAAAEIWINGGFRKDAEAIIRGEYEPYLRLLERALKLLVGGMRCQCAMDKTTCERCKVLADAAALGIGGTQE